MVDFDITAGKHAEAVLRDADRDLACTVGSIDNQLTCQAAQPSSGVLTYVISQPKVLADEDFLYAGDSRVMDATTFSSRRSRRACSSCSR